MSQAGVDLYWLPLGAGGHFVRFNGHVYEALVAAREHRPRLDLYHSALEISLPDGRFVIENAWPIPDRSGGARGVRVEGPVWTAQLARFHMFRYEIRCWPDGVIADLAEAVESPVRISDDESTARRLLELVSSVPALVWGRRPDDSKEMWNSNSVVAWLLARADLDAADLRPPTNGRAPGWCTGVEFAGETAEARGESQSNRRRNGPPLTNVAVRSALVTSHSSDQDEGRNEGRQSMTLIDRIRHRSEHHRALSKVVRFCDSCARVITPATSARRRREEMRDRSAGFPPS